MGVVAGGAAGHIARNDHRRAVAHLVEGTLCPAVVAKAVEHGQVGVLEGGAVGGCRLVVVGIGGRTGDDRVDRDAVAAKLLDDLAPLVDGGHDADGFHRAVAARCVGSVG